MTPHALFKNIGICLLFLLLVACASTTAPQKTTLAQAQLAYQQGNYRQAFLTLNALAVKGNREAQYALGYMYYYGQGTRPNTDLARGWFQQARAQGLTKAQKALDAIDRPIFPDTAKTSAVPPPTTPANPKPHNASTNKHNTNHPNNKQWAVQVASFTTPGNATRLQDDLTAQGYEVYRKTLPRTQGKPIIQILVGPLPKHTKARQLVATLRDTTGLEGLVVRYNPTKL